MLSSAAEFVTNQVLTTTLWNLAESGVHYTQQVVGHYLATTGGGAGTSLTADSAFQMDPETPQSKKIYCISFNQDCSSLAVGHDDGCSFYSLRSLDKLEKIQDAKVPERACIVEKLFSSSLITVVSLKSTRKLQVYHSTKENEICSHTYASSIIVVRMNRKRVIVCLEDAIHIHNVRDMRLMHIIKDTPPNPQGIMDLSNDDNNCFLAFPASSNTGHVHIFDAENLNTLCQIAAHDGVLAAIRFNPEGNKLATGSEKGTVIRVFSIPTGERLFEFTRGVSRCVSISSLAFSQDSRFLCLSSNTETIHVFALIKREQQQTEHSIQKPEETSQEKLNTWVSYLSQQASAYLPQQVNDLMLREKSATTARLPLVGARTAVAMPRIQGSDYLLVASFDGYLFVYSLPSPIESGECMFIKQFRIGPARVSPHEGEQDDLEGKPISIANRSSQRSGRTSESESQKPQTPTKPQSAAATMRAGTGGGSTSSLSSSSGTPTTKQVPPPMPPNPPKRITSSKSATPVKEFAKSNTNTGNPFDMEDLVVPLDDGGFEGRTGGDGASTNESQLNIIPPADLNDLDEFPPLHHATT